MHLEIQLYQPSHKLFITWVLGTLQGFGVGEPGGADVAGPGSERVLDRGCAMAVSKGCFCAR